MPSSPISPSAARRFRAARHLRVRQAGRSQAAGVGSGQGGIRVVAQQRARLEECWRARLERVTALSLAYHEEAQGPAPALSGGRSRRARLLARQAVAERQALAEIEAALDRLASGQYGWCEQCGRPIASALLAAQPQARYCAACTGSRRFSGSGAPCGPAAARSGLPGLSQRVNRPLAAR